MTRHVDIKALLSHIVNGDGIDKCRICMGDTNDGIVHLGDTVMMDGDQPVSLSELLEVVTGLEVALDEDLPSGICRDCADEAMAANAFRAFCLNAANKWHTTAALLDGMPVDVGNKESIYAFIQEDQITFVGCDRKEVEVKKESEEDDQEMKYLVPVTRKVFKSPKVKVSPNKFKCPDCERRFDYAKQLHSHLLNTSEDKQACFVCGAIMSRDNLTKHLLIAHETELFSCDKCPAILASYRQHKRHMLKHGLGAYSCITCGRSFTTMTGYNGHITSHIVRNCPNCDKRFTNYKCFTYHLRNCCALTAVNTGPRQTKPKVLFEISKENKKIKVGSRGKMSTECYCDYCGKKYAAKKFVAAHIQIVHLKNTHRPCPYCGKSYAAVHMTEHLKRHESESPAFTCDYCGILLKSRLGFMQHARLHTGEKPYKCTQCSETFSASSRRSEHMRKVHSGTNVLKHGCDVCPAKFRLPYQLRQHMETVHSSGNECSFECPHCQVKFGSFRGLLHHTKRHHSAPGDSKVNEPVKED